MSATTTIETLRKTLSEVLKPENVQAAEAIVKSLREAGASEKEVADALKVFVRPLAAEPPRGFPTRSSRRWRPALANAG